MEVIIRTYSSNLDEDNLFLYHINNKYIHLLLHFHPIRL